MSKQSTQPQEVPVLESGESQLEFVHRIIREQLERKYTAAGWYRGEHVRIQLVGIVVSGAVTVIAGVQSLVQDRTWTTIAILLLGACATGLATWRATFTPKESWQLNQMLYNQLRALQTDLQFKQRAPNFEAEAPNVLKATFDDFQRIINQGNTAWQDLRQKDK